jgi:fluoride ion exporter CrcB/FEX
LAGAAPFRLLKYETFRVFQDGEFLIAGLNIALSVAVGFFSVWVGVITGRTIA